MNKRNIVAALGVLGCAISTLVFLKHQVPSPIFAKTTAGHCDSSIQTRVAHSAVVAAPPAQLSAHEYRCTPGLNSLWGDPNSPVFNGDRSVPVTLEVATNKVVTFIVDSTVQKRDNTWVTVGHTANEGSVVVAAKVGNVASFAIVDPVGGNNYYVVPSADGVRVIEAFSIPKSFGDGLPARPQAGRPIIAADNQSPEQTFDDLSVTPSTNRITIAGYYSKSVGAHIGNYGGEDGLLSSLQVSVALLNVALSRARADAYFEVVGIQVLENAVERPNDKGLLSIDTLNQFDSAYTAASADNKVRLVADYRVMIPEGNGDGWAGVGWQPGNSCAIIARYLASTVLPHEVGHNLGMAHNKENAASSTTTYGYGFWADAPFLDYSGGKIGTIMSYVGRECLTYSNPDYTVHGIAMGAAASADNARVARDSVKYAGAAATGDYSFVGDEWLINESTRGYVGTGADVLIVGLVVNGTLPKQIVFRALGPSLANYGVTGCLENPTITLYGSDSKPIMNNDDWRSGGRIAEVRAANLAPSGDRDSALVATLNPGAYTIILSGVGDKTGIGLLEAYSIDPEVRTFKLVGPTAVRTGWDGPIVGASYVAGEKIWPSTPEFRQNADVLILSSQPFRIAGSVTRWIPRTILSILANHPQRDQIKAFTGYARDDMYVEILSNADPKYGFSFYPWTDFDYDKPAPRNGEYRMYALEPSVLQSTRPAGNFVNLSTRGLIGMGDKSLIAGFVVQGNSPKTYAIRALGEFLRQFGINNPAKNIAAEVYSGSTLLKRFAVTAPEDKTTLAGRNLLSPNATDICGLITLAPGAYTLVLSAKTEADVGVGLVEVYEQ
jgi:hypothetical protein